MFAIGSAFDPGRRPRPSDPSAVRELPTHESCTMVKQITRNLARAAHDRVFKSIHGGRLIYNTCWEDPRIDRQLMHIGPESKIVVITSAGCNALDYLLDDPTEVHCVDVNERQNALLHLKLALLAHGSYDDLFDMFGRGRHHDPRGLLRRLAPRMPGYARAYWQRNIRFFRPDGVRKSFYYHGTSGEVAWLLRYALLAVKPRLRPYIDQFLESPSIEAQQELYRHVEPILWDRLTRWLIKQPMVMAMMGVPRQQIRLIDDHHPEGLAGFVKDKFSHVMTEVAAADNYFWRVYMTGSYTPECCPNYLRAEHFDTLAGRVGRVGVHTNTISGFLAANPGAYTHFVLLDHQDWLAWHDPEALLEEWDLIRRNAAPGAMVLMRSAGIDLSFVPEPVRQAVRFRPDLTEPLHQTDRVGTYGSLHLAELDGV